MLPITSNLELRILADISYDFLEGGSALLQGHYLHSVIEAHKERGQTSKLQVVFQPWSQSSRGRKNFQS
jgi:hypothetical protein